MKIVYPLTALAASLLAAGAACLAADGPAAWPCWRGPAGNGVSDERGWNSDALTDGAKVLWRTNVNAGFSSVVVRGDRLYTAGWRSNTGTVFCLNAQTGGPVWRYDYACKAVTTEGSRGTPTLDGDSLYALTERGLVLCLDAAKGDSE